MKKYSSILILITFPLLFWAQDGRDFKFVEIDTIANYNGSIRAIGLDINKNLWVATEIGEIGFYSNEKGLITTTPDNNVEKVNFRSIAFSSKATFILSISNPALLYKVGYDLNDEKVLVYSEDHEKVFYDSMAFWNENEGIAMGDPTDGCLSIIITRDGGNNWNKIPCDLLPKTEEGEAAFAASNTNIAIVEDKTWLVTGGESSRVFYSPDKGNSWQVFNTPMINGGSSGIYSVDFYDENNGIIFGGDYSKPDENKANKAITKDGGKTWILVADGQEPGYRSCVQYMPHGKGKEIVAVGYKGISYSKDGGESWKQISDEGFYTLVFLNESVAYAAGKGRVAKVSFKE